MIIKFGFSSIFLLSNQVKKMNKKIYEKLQVNGNIFNKKLIKVLKNHLNMFKCWGFEMLKPDY